MSWGTLYTVAFLAISRHHRCIGRTGLFSWSKEADTLSKLPAWEGVFLAMRWHGAHKQERRLRADRLCLRSLNRQPTRSRREQSQRVRPEQFGISSFCIQNKQSQPYRFTNVLYGCAIVELAVYNAVLWEIVQAEVCVLVRFSFTMYHVCYLPKLTQRSKVRLHSPTHSSPQRHDSKGKWAMTEHLIWTIDLIPRTEDLFSRSSTAMKKKCKQLRVWGVRN